MVTNIVKEEFKDIELHHRSCLNFMVIRDTQQSRKLIFVGIGELFFLTFGFKESFHRVRIIYESDKLAKLLSEMGS